MSAIRQQMVCSTCGSTDVVRDAWAEWSVERQQWELSAVFDAAFCQDCEADTQLDERDDRTSEPGGPRVPPSA